MMMRIGTTLGALALVTVMAVSLSLRASAWTLTTTGFQVVRKALSNDSAGNLVFQWGADSRHYLYGTAPRKISGTLTATFQIDVTSGAPTFVAFEPQACADPPSAHFFVWSNHLGWGDFDRWWGIDAYPLAIGQQTVTIPLEADRWVAVYRSGSAFPDLFAQAMQNVSAVGLTFGGHDCNYGH